MRRAVSMLFFALILSGFIMLDAQTAGQPQTPLQSRSEKDLFKLAEQVQGKDPGLACDALKAAFAKRKEKPHKKYTPLRDQQCGMAADALAADGLTALKKLSLEDSEKAIAAAKKYASTPAVQSLEKALAGRIAELKKQYDLAGKLAEEREFEKSVAELKTLLPFEKYVPGVAGRIEAVNAAFVDDLIRQGTEHCAGRRWEEATQAFLKVQLMEAGNEKAAAGLEAVGRGKQAESIANAVMAKKRSARADYKYAVYELDRASRMDPGWGVLSEMKTRVKNEWILYCETELQNLLNQSRSFSASRDACVALEDLRDLRPDHPLVAAHWSTISAELAQKSYNRSVEITQEGDYSRLATAYALLFNARNRGDSGVSDSDLKTAAAEFNKKRQTMIGIETVNQVTGTPVEFLNVLENIAVNAVENIGLNDLLVFRRQSSDFSKMEDTRFQGVRPDGRSYKALLKVEIVKHMSERIAAPPEPVRSEHLLEYTEQDNPEYIKKNEQLNNCLKNMVPPNKTPKPNQFDKTTCDRMEKELGRIDIKIKVPVKREYYYKRIKHTQVTELEITLKLIDADGNQLIEQKSYVDSGKLEGTEIADVHPEDMEKRRNEPLLMIPADQAMEAARRRVGDQIRKEAPGFIAKFTERFLNGGKLMMERGNNDEAVEYFLCYWAFVHGQVGSRLSEADARLIRDFIKQETGYDLESSREDFMALIRSGWSIIM